MATDHILSLLRAERDKLTAAIEALQGPTAAAPGPDRKAVPPPVEQDSAPAKRVTPPPPAKRKLSEAGRQAIIAATKKRWADIKAQKASATVPVAASPKAAPAKQKSAPAKDAAFRKRMSDRMKAAWAARRKKAAGKAKG